MTKSIIEQLKDCELNQKREFRYKLNSEIKAIDVFKTLKQNGYSPEIEEDTNGDLFVVVQLKNTKVVNLVDYKPKKRVLSVEENVIKVAFGKVN